MTSITALQASSWDKIVSNVQPFIRIVERAGGRRGQSSRPEDLDSDVRALLVDDSDSEEPGDKPIEKLGDKVGNEAGDEPGNEPMVRAAAL